ncbi:unnamed protein product [Musa banksii]
MDDYAREMMDLKTLVTRTLEKKGVLAKIRVKCYPPSPSSIFLAIVSDLPSMIGFRPISVVSRENERLFLSHLSSDTLLDILSWYLCLALGVFSREYISVEFSCSELAELRASVFEAIEEEDRAIQNDDNVPPALLGSCNDRAKQLHTSPSGRLLTALIGEYLEWAQLGHTLKVYLPECNLPKDFWRDELKDFSSTNRYDSNRNGECGPLLLDVLEGYLKYENLTQNRVAGGRLIDSDTISVSSVEARNVRRPSSSSAAPGGLPSLGRPVPRIQTSERKSSSSVPMNRKDDYMWKYDVDEVSEDVIRAANALENIQLDRKARNLTSSWRHASDGTMEDDGMVDHH